MNFLKSNYKNLILSLLVLGTGFGVGYYLKGKPKATFASETPVLEWKTAILKDTEGKEIRPYELPGNLFVVYFGFSHCPDMCPMALNDIENAFHILKEDSKNITPIFVTVDPERDTPEVLRKYIERFPGKELVALTGSKEQIENLQKGFGVFSQKTAIPRGNGEYGVDHSLFIYLVDTTGNILRAYPTGIKGEELAKEIRELL
ncbi:SCO family protein [Leptospira sarikeiensis]|uniref:SCO family protein n=1 Tax=Leptospira sarikeiensis TaxID=2484943 RepID=A0A4R9K5Y7_9LEPT|nr:SCO family protein [Leptospira sarikeiensis]TGL61658.1 SCO family protein [Leptospira sarikeiensis]